MNHPDTVEGLKKGYFAVRIFSKKGFAKIAQHAPEKTRKYIGYLKDTEIVSISVVDVGRGIWSALDPEKAMSELGCIKAAFKEHVSSKPKTSRHDPERGMGLFEVQELINRQEGYLEVRSGRSRHIMMLSKSRLRLQGEVGMG